MSAAEQVLNDAFETCRRLVEHQQWQQVSDICAKIDQVVPDHPQVILFAGLADMGLGRIDDADGRFGKLVQLIPDLAMAHSNLAQISLWRGDIAGAIEHLGNAAEHVGDDADAHCKLAEFLLLTGALGRGKAALDKAREYAPGHSFVGAVTRAFEAAEEARGRVPDNRLVAIISDDPRVREAKLAAACTHQGWRAVLFCRNLPGYDAREYFADVFQYDDPWDAVAKVSALRPHTYHCCAQMKYETCAAFLAARPGPIICDLYDNVEMLSDDFFAREPVRRFDRALERSVLTRADGLVCRNLESQHAKRRQGVDVPAKRLFFTEYAWGDIEKQPKLSSQDGELHIFYGGSFWIEKQYPEYADCGGMYWLAELLSEQKVHFHLYPAAGSAEQFDDLFSDYRALDERSCYFHLHRPIRDMRTFLTEASQYDAGIFAIKAYLEGGTMRQYAPTKMRYAYGNKLTDYIDAGLSFIAHKGIFMYQIARHLGVAIDIGEDFREKSFWDRVKKQILQPSVNFDAVVRRFDLRGQAPRLIRFYESFR